jgi:S-adenosylmethionine synthetase
MSKYFQQTSEAVSIGHPDKVADSIADAIVDYIRQQLFDAHTAIEVACGAKKLFIFGEIDYRVDVSRETMQEDIINIVTQRIADIGYTKEEYNPEVVFDLVQQSTEINSAVENSSDTHETGAGDQGIMFGYAIKETPEYHSLHFVLAHLLQKELEKKRLSGEFFFLRPDAKTQVTVEYEYTEKSINQPRAINDIVLSTQHVDTDFNTVKNELTHFVVETVNNYLTQHDFNFLISKDTKIHINPAGPWLNGGPAFDSGLTGRKLVVDNYGGNAPIGGGAYSGKDLTKVDRSAAYYARFVAKSVVAAGLAEKIQVALAYAIGESEPTMISVDTYGTGIESDSVILQKIRRNFNFSVKSIIARTSRVKSFVKTGEHSHYLATQYFIDDKDDVFPWESEKAL